MNRSAASAFAALALGLGSGCTAIDPYLPTVAFDRLDVGEIDWEYVDADFVFTVSNPNPVEIKLARFDYALSFSEVDWLSGDDPDGLVLAASSGSELALPLSIEFTSLYDMVQATRGLDDIPFALSGSFGFDTPAGIVDLPYDADGDFPALRTPTITYDRIRIDEIGLTSATLEVELDVDNDHGSNIAFQNFDYTLELNGDELGSGFVDLLGEVGGASTDVVSVPVEVSFLTAAEGIYDALTSSSAKLGLQASTDVDTPFGVVPLSIDQSGRISID